MTTTSPAVRNSIVDSASSASALRAQIQLIQSAMRDVMIDGVHYGKIPGVQKPSLLKPGAEVLCSMFHIAPLYFTEDLSTSDCVRYRVRCLGRHQGTSVDLGEGVGECSTDEDKYRWRAPVCDEEFEATPEDQRRVKWARGASGGAYSQKQVRTAPANLANTALKMAAKRAQVAMVLNVLAASDIFSQADDLPEGSGGDDAPTRGVRRSAPQRPRARTGDGLVTDSQQRLLRARLTDAGMSAEDLCARFRIDSVTKLPFDQMNAALAWIADPEREAIQHEAEHGPNSAEH